MTVRHDDEMMPRHPKDGIRPGGSGPRFESHQPVAAYGKVCSTAPVFTSPKPMTDSGNANLLTETWRGEGGNARFSHPLRHSITFNAALPDENRSHSHPFHTELSRTSRLRRAGGTRVVTTVKSPRLNGSRSFDPIGKLNPRRSVARRVSSNKTGSRLVPAVQPETHCSEKTRSMAGISRSNAFARWLIWRFTAESNSPNVR